MNIFVLDMNFEKNAQCHTDSHVVKMILESAQLMSSAVRFSGIDAGYKLTHVNHPCAKWARESLSNWLWLRTLSEALHEEWRYRGSHPTWKNHKSAEMIMSLPLPNIKEIGLTEFALCMPDEFKVPSDAVQSYRNYYREAKKHLHKWKNRQVPDWLEDYQL